MAIPTVGGSRAEFADPVGPGGRFGGLSIEHLALFDAASFKLIRLKP